MAERLQNLYHEYIKAVKQNSPSIAQFESAFRLISYAIAGRFEDSTILSELLYSASNLLVLFNDAIIQKASGILPVVTASQERLQSLVTVLEYVGVFIEMAAQRSFGDVGRWAAIVIVQLTKCVARFLLLSKHKVGIQTVPPLAPVDRELLLKQTSPHDGKTPDNGTGQHVAESPRKKDFPSDTFTLRRSGKVMRTLSRAPPVNRRDWRLPPDSPAVTPATPDVGPEVKGNHRPTPLTSARTCAECLYILKPLLHLSSLSVCGTDSYKPWLLSAGLDISSLCMMGDTADLNSQEKTELKRRSLMCLMYLLRSPFYERHSKERLLRLLSAVSATIPGTSLIMGPLMEYLPVWQQIYFYTWSS